MNRDEIQKPFKSGRCRECYLEKKLCDRCEAYASQDYVRRKTTEIRSGLMLNKFPVNVDYESLVAANEEKEGSVLPYETLVNAGRLSGFEKKIITFRFFDELSFGDISKRLDVSKGSVQKSYKRALKKLRFCLTKNTYIEGQGVSKSSLSHSSQRSSSEKSEKISSELQLVCEANRGGSL